ncbi:MAG: cation-translocating P-type ATPase [Alphaproteobacteria bacterium]|nr:cation-translocating P-type ATPase [Alphaproteobacteria bacterium]
MSCCAPGTEGSLQLDAARQGLPSNEELLLSSQTLDDGLHQIDLSVPDVHCGGCIKTIEDGLSALPLVQRARVNLSTKRVSVVWSPAQGDPAQIVQTLSTLGYQPHLFDLGVEGGDETLSMLVRSLAVAGFAAANIMLLSVSVWSGAEASTRDLFHWISAVIAIPALAYSGRVFFRSAFSALSHGRLNMDVPISLAVVLAFLMSLYETANSGEHAYFDASVTLLFFLLIGRTLDHVMRERARSAVKGLARLAPRGAMVVGKNGQRDFLPIEDITTGMTILLAAGDRVPVDARVVKGVSDLDCSLVNGESVAQTVTPGEVLRAGTLNLTGPLTIEALAPARQSFLAEMIRLMEVAEGAKAGYRRLADRAAQLYAPVVHLVALLSFVGWLAVSGDWQRALYIAIAVLIITCPCALALAVPVVQVVASGRLFEAGIMVKDGTAMERLAEIDSVTFDKTGTLTLGQPRLINRGDIGTRNLMLAAALGAHSRHPLSRALAAAAPDTRQAPPSFDSIKEEPGAGLEATRQGVIYRLGRANWALDPKTETADPADSYQPGQTVLSADGVFLAAFVFDDALRPDAAAAVAALRNRGLAVDMVSGDQVGIVRRLAEALGIPSFKGGVLPEAKSRHVAGLAEAGHRVLMVGDGLNDAPALVRAHVSMAPATAADVGRNAADFVFLHDSLSAVTIALDVSRKAGQLIRQNFALAILYNMIAIPTAVLGYATPLVAALAMSSSSIVVVLNSLRLRRPNPADHRAKSGKEESAVGLLAIGRGT